MNVISCTWFSVPQEQRRFWRVALDRLCPDRQWTNPLNERGRIQLFCKLGASDPRYHELLQLLRKHEIPWSESFEHIYTVDELRSFPLLHLTVERNEIGPFGPVHGTTYDLSKACPECGTGAVQTSPFYAPAKSFPKAGLIAQSSTETFVGDPLVGALRGAEITGVDLRQACSNRDHRPLPWWQIIPRFTMPRMGPATKGIIHSEKDPPCQRCRRDGHYNTLSEPEHIAYMTQDVNADALPDVVQTWECFGKSRLDKDDFRHSRFAEPATLVRTRVFDIFHELRVRHARFAPVSVV